MALPEGGYRVEVSREGYLTVAREVAVAGATLEQIELEPYPQPFTVLSDAGVARPVELLEDSRGPYEARHAADTGGLPHTGVTFADGLRAPGRQVTVAAREQSPTRVKQWTLAPGMGAVRGCSNMRCLSCWLGPEMDGDSGRGVIRMGCVSVAGIAKMTNNQVHEVTILRAFAVSEVRGDVRGVVRVNGCQADLQKAYSGIAVFQIIGHQPYRVLW